MTNPNKLDLEFFLIIGFEAHVKYVSNVKVKRTFSAGVKGLNFLIINMLTMKH